MVWGDFRGWLYLYIDTVYSMTLYVYGKSGDCLPGDGRLRYIPSEELAAQVAEQLKATKLIFFTRGLGLGSHRRSTWEASGSSIRCVARCGL